MPANAVSNHLFDPAELCAMSAHAVTKGFRKNTIIVNEGDTTDALHIIQSGKVKAFVSDEQGKEITLSVQGPGEYFGEMALDGGPRSASIVTLEASKFLIIPRSDVADFLKTHPDFAMHLVQQLIRRVRVLTETVKNLALRDVYGRLTRMLEQLAIKQQGKLVINEKLTQQEIASRIGASREMVSRIFKELVIGHYISIERRQIVINKTLPLQW